MADVSVLERRLSDLSSQAARQDTEDPNTLLWNQVESTSQALADALRSRDGPVDNHAFLGRTSLAQSVKLLLTTATDDGPIPTDQKASAVLQLIRVAANFCIDSNENRSQLLEASVIQVVLSLLEAYNDKVSDIGSQPAELSELELKLLRTILGALLNASLGYDEIKNRLNSLEAGLTILKLITKVYPVGAWVKIPAGAQASTEGEWDLRSTISSWGWRLVSELRNTKDEAVPSFGVDVLPLLTPPLAAFIPPFEPSSKPISFEASTLASLVEKDFDVLEDACTLIESLTLDVEDIRLALAGGSFPPAEQAGAPYLSTILDFVEQGDYPPTWDNLEVFDETESLRRKKEFGMCKAALVKAIVEVAGEEKNAKILWDESEDEQPKSTFVHRMIRWIKSYAEEANATEARPGPLRDDLAIAASLSLGNLSRQPSRATVLLSPPYSLANVLVSPLFLSTGTDLKLKHAILGLLKNLAQSAPLSPIVHKRLGDAGIVRLLMESGVWDERADMMADVVQLNAIGIMKHLCSADVSHTCALVIPKPGSSTASGLEQILALVNRTDSVPVKSEGSRVLVNVIKSLWAVKPSNQTPSQDRQKDLETATGLVLIQDSADVLAALLGRSGRYPILVNESILALTLLSMHPEGGPIVVKALTNTISQPVSSSDLPPTSPTSDVSSPAVASPISRSRLHVPRHALDMLVFVLRNVDNPANYPVEARVNVCSLLLQLTKHTSQDDLAKVKDVARSTLEKLLHRLRDATDRDGMLRDKVQDVLLAWAEPS